LWPRCWIKFLYMWRSLYKLVCSTKYIYMIWVKIDESQIGFYLKILILIYSTKGIKLIYIYIVVFVLSYHQPKDDTELSLKSRHRTKSYQELPQHWAQADQPLPAKVTSEMAHTYMVNTTPIKTFTMQVVPWNSLKRKSP